MTAFALILQLIFNLPAPPQEHEILPSRSMWRADNGRAVCIISDDHF
jgi:hypothetical protein